LPAPQSAEVRQLRSALGNATKANEHPAKLEDLRQRLGNAVLRQQIDRYVEAVVAAAELGVLNPETASPETKARLARIAELFPPGEVGG
jgi:hypothetical protein